MYVGIPGKMDALVQTFSASSLTTTSGLTLVMAVEASTAVAPRSITTLYLTWGRRSFKEREADSEPLALRGNNH